MVITWVVSNCEVLEQSLKLAFQTIFARAIKIRHGGSEESVDAVRRQFSESVADHFTGSADVPD